MVFTEWAKGCNNTCICQQARYSGCYACWWGCR